ncbi:MAG TPA: NAD(P)/FAD-dependent oxidoreductase [Rhizomicrobium sp.]|jgi:phytoene dehydrogenase-like protein
MTGDAIVIGAGVNGLVAAAYLARAGRRVTVLEGRHAAGGACASTTMGGNAKAPGLAHAVYALDPALVRELGLVRHGLAFAARDLPLVGLRPDGKHLVISRDLRATEHNLALQSRADAKIWRSYREGLFGFARAMRAQWWNDRRTTAEDALARISRQGTGPFLDSWFESEGLKATLAFDASAASPLAAGSALLLAWRVAQEMGGLQGATAILRGGSGALIDALLAAIRVAGVSLRLGGKATEILVERGRVCGVRLASGETLSAPLVLSSLDRRATLVELARGECLGLEEWSRLANEKPRVASAKIHFLLGGMPKFSGIAVPTVSRFVLAERWQTYAASHAAARLNAMVPEVTCEFLLPTVADNSLAPEGLHIMSVLVRPLPLSPLQGWPQLKADLAARVITMAERVMPGVARLVRDVRVSTPDQMGESDCRDATVRRLLASWNTRISTPIAGLYLCGASAEPASAVSGRAARIAAQAALRDGELR